MPYIYVEVEDNEYIRPVYIKWSELERMIRIWLIVDHTRPTDELISRYEEIMSDVAEKLYKGKGTGGMYNWILVDKEGFFSDYHVQTDLAEAEEYSFDRENRNTLSKETADWFFTNEISGKLRQGDVLTKEETDLLYTRLLPFYDRLNKLQAHVIYYGAQLFDIRGAGKSPGIKGWEADTYSSYPARLQTMVEEAFGTNAYSAFANLWPETDQKICIYVFDRPVEPVKTIRNFITTLTRQTDWTGTVDVLYLNESNFWKNQQIIRSVSTGKYKIRGPHGVWNKSLLGDNSRDALFPETGFTLTHSHDRKQFYKSMILYPDLDLEDTEYHIKVVYDHYQAPITADPDVDFI